MENLVLIKADELRQLIREELTNIPVTKEAAIVAKQQPITTKELCVFLGITEPTVIRWRKKGKIPFMQIGSSIRFDLTAVLAALEIKSKKKGATQ